MSLSSASVTFGFAKRHGVLVVSTTDEVANIVYHRAPKASILLELQRFLGKRLCLEWVTEDDFSARLTQAYEKTSGAAQQMIDEMEDDLDLYQLVQNLPKTEDLLESDDDAPIIRLLNALISQAIKQAASDIHIEVYEEKLLVRFRIDGVLHEMLQPQAVLAPLLISRIKIMAKLDIAEKRLPQDGRIALRIGGRSVDVRVSTMPASHGERVVLRLLDKKSAPLNLRSLGMSEATLNVIEQLIARPHGILLVTGPTGSGKTTTLYAALSALNNTHRNILTVEDPIEYYLPGVGQTQVNYKVDMTFAKGLRAMLRQDPDVVMVGEIRDLETAEIAVQASLTGHLVLSTLHTNSAIGAITRLRDVGVEPFLLSSSLIGVLAQRLVRILCRSCKKAHVADASECAILMCDPAIPPTIYQSVGCAECNMSGYKGRTGIYEVIALDEDLRVMIHDNANQQKIEAHARSLSPSMRADGCRRVLNGDTTLEEILRVTSKD
jgi:general secretion pathway protein E